MASRALPPPLVPQEEDDIEDLFVGLHTAACGRREATYEDPATGFAVFTEYAHRSRGKCCGSGCRHCPFAHVKVPAAKRPLLPHPVLLPTVPPSPPGSGEGPVVSAVAAASARKVNEDKGRGSLDGPPPSPPPPIAPARKALSKEEEEEEEEENDDDDGSDGSDKDEAASSRRRKGRSHGQRVYTRTGDGGTSQLFTGERRGKEDGVFEALGSVDELAAFVGAAREECRLQGGLAELVSDLERILTELIDVGSNIATPTIQHITDNGLPSTATATATRKGGLSGVRRARTAFEALGAAAVATLERRIDEMTDTLPPLSSFILPSGGRAAAALHVSRTVCRRTERRVLLLKEPLKEEAAGRKDGQPREANPLRVVVAYDAAVPVYLNRLSDFLFTAARLAARDSGEEVAYARQPSQQSPSLVDDDNGGGGDGGRRNGVGEAQGRLKARTEFGGGKKEGVREARSAGDGNRHRRRLVRVGGGEEEAGVGPVPPPAAHAHTTNSPPWFGPGFGPGFVVGASGATLAWVAASCLCSSIFLGKGSANRLPR